MYGRLKNWSDDLTKVWRIAFDSEAYVR